MNCVVGASGHIGNNLVRLLLENGQRVRAVVRHDTAALADLAVEIVRCDVTDREQIVEAVKGCSRVYHLAALITIGGHSASDVMRTNVLGTQNVVQACLETGVERLVHFSSVHAFTQGPLEEVLDENRPLATGDVPLYDRSKAESQALVLSAATKGQLAAVVINPTGVIGPNDFKPSYMGRVIRLLMEGRLPALVHAGFDWVDVRDVAEGAVAAMEKGRSGECYLLSGHYATLLDIAWMVHRFGGKRPPRVVAPMWLARAGLPFMRTLQRLGLVPGGDLFTRESLDALRCNRHVSHFRASQELGYVPRPLEQTIKDVVHWFSRRSTRSTAPPSTVPPENQ